MEKPKENNCYMMFYCNDKISGNNCVYKSDNIACKYLSPHSMSCNSSVAQVNRMILHAKQIGLELTAKGFENAIITTSSDGTIFNE
jgi:hypothetical protein